MLSMLMALLALGFLSTMAFWQPNAVLFMLAGAVGIFTGLYWFSTFATNLGLAIGLCLLLYGFYCWALAFRMLFWRRKE